MAGLRITVDVDVDVIRAGKLALNCEPAEEGPPDGFRVVAVRVVAGPGDPHEAHVRIRGRHGVAVGDLILAFAGTEVT